jgi:hypothetical protein
VIVSANAVHGARRHQNGSGFLMRGKRLAHTFATTTVRDQERIVIVILIKFSKLVRFAGVSLGVAGDL